MRGPMSYNILKFTIYPFFFVILLACPLPYDFSEHVYSYLNELCTNLGIGLPRTQKTCVALLLIIARRYADNSYSQIATENNTLPNNAEDWEIFFDDVEWKYGKVEALLKATRLAKIPEDHHEWAAAKYAIEILIKDSFDFETEKYVKLIFKSKKNSTCDFKKAFTDLAKLYPFESLPHSLKDAIEKCQYLFQKCQELDRKCEELDRKCENVKEKCEIYRKYKLKVSPRTLFNLMEEKYRDDYYNEMNEQNRLEQENQNKYGALPKNSRTSYAPLYTTPSTPSNDPKTIRIEERKNFWNWMLKHRSKESDIELILQNMELQFRKMHKPAIPIDQELTVTEIGEFEKFKMKTCLAIAEAQEADFFIIHVIQAVDLFKGQLEELDFFGESIDPYILPVINAIVPINDPHKPCVVFKENNEKTNLD